MSGDKCTINRGVKQNIVAVEYNIYDNIEYSRIYGELGYVNASL